MSETTVVNREKLMSDLRTVIADAEEVLKVTADQANSGAAELRVRMQERLQQAKIRLQDLRGRALVLREYNDNYKNAPPLGGAGGIASCGLVP